MTGAAGAAAAAGTGAASGTDPARSTAQATGTAGVNRRRMLLGGAVAGAGLTALTACSARAEDEQATAEAARRVIGSDTIPFHGEHQAGIATEPQAFAALVALDLRDGADRDAIRRMLTVLTDDAERLTRGVGALADTEPELAASPARLTVTVGFGPELVRRVAGKSALPSWLRPLPSFAIDRLEERWNDGDLLLLVAADDQVTVAHATRMLLKTARSTAVPRWRQSGFRRARGSEKPGTTMRNLFGQIDGTVNLRPEDDDFAAGVWSQDGWMTGGTSLVIRRIRMDLDGWDRLDTPGRDMAMGRRQSDGAPLTGEHEFDEPDFEAVGPHGFTVIPDFSHIARARGDDPRPTMLRRSWNYDDDLVGGDGPLGGDEDGPISDSGLLFLAYQADVDTGFVPVQQRLSELDLLNQWTTPVGSAVFAIPPGCAEGGFIGETLF